MTATSEKIKFLMCFAHRGEAVSFLENLPWKQITSSKITGLYQYQNWGLLITGEGLPQASHKLGILLGELSKENPIEHVYNFGICGSVSKKHIVNSSFWIRQIYFENSSQEFQFQSYSCSTPNTSDPVADLISVNSRVLDKSHGEKLYPVAPLVDREAWGQAQVCQLLKIPFSSFKVISDTTVDKPEESGNLCRLVQDQAKTYSDMIFTEWKKIADLTKVEIQDTEKQLHKNLMKNKSFHWTISQQHKLDHCLMRLKAHHYSDENIADFIQKKNYEKMKLSPKERSKLLLEDLSELVNPLQSEIRKQLAQTLHTSVQKNIGIYYDGQLEEEGLSIEIQAQTEEELQNSLEALNKLDLKNYFRMMKGHVDVRKDSH